MSAIAMIEQVSENSDLEKDAVNSLAATVKACALYPPNHSIPSESFNRCLVSLKRVLSSGASFQISITKDGIYVSETKIYAPARQDDPLWFPLFRDGIVSVEFKTNLSPSELQRLIDIICKHGSLNAESEGDIATELWGSALSGITYRAVDTLFDMKGFDAGSFKINPHGVSKDVILESTPYNGFLNASPKSKDILRLTDADTALLKELIDHDNKRDKDADLADVLISTLDNSEDIADCNHLMPFIAQEFCVSLSDGNLHLSVKMLRAVLEADLKFPGSNLLNGAFWTAVNKTQLTQVLRTAITTIKSPHVPALKEVLSSIHPDVIHNLADCLESISAKHHAFVIDTMVVLSSKSLAQFERLLNRENTYIQKIAITILGMSPKIEAIKILQKAARNPSESVRYNAVLQLIKLKAIPPDKVYHLLNDRSTGVREKLLSYLSMEKSKINEGLLRNFLENSDGNIHPVDLVDYYMALGKCGSDESIPYLSKRLLNNPLTALVRKETRIHIKGAAIALLNIGTRDAKEVLSKAARSYTPWVRAAYKRALESKYASDIV